MPGIYRLCANEYVHVEDGNTGEVFTLLGPLTFTLLDHLTPLQPEPQPCVVVPPDCYVTIRNPVHRSGGNDPKSTAGYQLICEPKANNTALLTQPTVAHCQYGAVEFRFSSSQNPTIPSSPFPLFPGEIAEPPERLPLLQSNEALLLLVKEKMEVTDNTSGAKRIHEPGDYRMFRGPGLYYPDTKETIVRRIVPHMVNPAEALWLRAMQPFVEEEHHADRSVTCTHRTAGEEWTRTTPGIYFQHPHVEIVKVIKPEVLSPSTAVLLEARYEFLDDRKLAGNQTPKQRVPGETWVLTYKDIQAFTPTHNEKIVRRIPRTILGPRQYCKVKNPYDVKSGENKWGAIELREGPRSFFLYPGEQLLDGRVWDAYDCSADEALLVQALTAFKEEKKNVKTGKKEEVEHQASSRWLIRGPCCYTPPLAVKVLEWRKVIQLSQHQGVYVQNMVTGNIRSVFGAPFMLSEDEVLWEKPVSDLVRSLLQCNWRTGATNVSEDHKNSKRLPTKPRPRYNSVGPLKHYEGFLSVPVLDLQPYEVITANVEQNHLVRLYNASDGSSRVVAGPCTVYLSPHEEFTVMSLSGGRPKKPDQIQSLRLFLGPDYMADVVLVETLDHTRLRLSLAYNWEFDTTDMSAALDKAFAISDFIGEACRALASRVRAVIAGVTFENFHLHSTSIIRQAIFCSSGDGLLKVTPQGHLYFSVNGLLITNVDVQQVQPADNRTLQALKKSVQLAVEIITKSQENEATHQAALLEQEAAGALELQVMKDHCEIEAQRLQILEVEGSNAEIELIGASTAHAVAQRESRIVEVEATVEAAPKRCQAYEVAQEAELQLLHKRIEVDLEHQKKRNALLLQKKRALAEVEASKYEKIMNALGKETVVSLAEAGPELQEQLLQALGLQGFLITDGKSPLNLLDMASKMASTENTEAAKLMQNIAAAAAAVPPS